MNKAVAKVDSITKKMDELKNAKVENTTEWQKLRKDIDATKTEIQTLTEKTREMRNVKMPTEEYVEIQTHLQNVQKEFDKLYAKQEKLQALGQTSGKAWDSLQYSMEELGNAIEADKIDLQNLIAEGKAFQSQKGTDGYKQLKKDLQTAYGKMRELKGEEKELETAFNSDKTAGLEQLSRELKEAQGDVELTELKMQKLNASSKTNALSKIASNAKKGFKKLSSAIGGAISKMKNLHTSTKKTNGGFSNLIKTMKQMVLSMAVFQAMSKGVEFLKSGLQNLAVYSKEYNKQMSALVSSTGMLKNSLAVAFAPIISAVIPYLVKLIDWVSAAANAVSRFFAILGGKSTYTKAIKQNKDYAASLDKVGSSAEEAKGSLAGFDDLDVLQKNDTSSGGSGGASSGADGSGFQEESVGEISDWAQSFKDAIDAGDWYSVGALVAQKLNEALASIDWGFVQDKAAGFATNLALALNGFVDELDWNLLGSTIANGINTALVFVYTFLTTFSFEELGTGLADGINGAFSTISWKIIGDTVIAGIQGMCDMVVAFLDELDIFEGVSFDGLREALDGLGESLLPFSDNLGSGLQWFLENVLIPLAAWTVSEALPEFLDALSGAIDVVNQGITDAQPMFQWFWDYILAPIAEWTGGVIVEALNGIGDALSWISQNEVAMTVLESLALAIGIVQGAITAYNIVAGIMSIVTGTAAVSAGLLGSVLAFLTSPVTIVTAVIAALIAIGILLYQNWDTICEKATEIWGAIKEFISNAIEKVKDTITSVINKIKEVWGNIWGTIKTTVTNIWDGIKSRITDTINGIKTGISTALNTIKTIWNNIWTSLKTTVTNIFNGIWKTIKGVINSILGGIEGMANGVIKGINKVIGAMNGLSFDIPDWVPGMGGKTFGFNISELNEVKIPRLANGGITTGSTLANIGEAGREAILPLENNTGWMDDLASKLASKMPTYGTPSTLVMEVDGKEFARLSLPYFNDESRRIGVSLVSG